MEMKIIVTLQNKPFLKEVRLFWGKLFIARNVKMKRKEVLDKTSEEANCCVCEELTIFLRYQFWVLGIQKSKLMSAAKQFIELKGFYKRRIYLRAVMQKCGQCIERENASEFQH